MLEVLGTRRSSFQQTTDEKCIDISIGDGSPPPTLSPLPALAPPGGPSPIALPAKALLRDTVSGVTRFQKLVDLDVMGAHAISRSPGEGRE